MTNADPTAMAAECKHNFIRITRSTIRETPYLKCSKCGRIEEVRQSLTDRDGEG